MVKLNYKAIRRSYKGIHTIRCVSRSKRYKLKRAETVKEEKQVPSVVSNVSNLAQILEDFIELEDKNYQKFNFNHNPTLGSMYEALTENVVDKVLPKGLNLRIVGGFIYGDSDYISGEIDRMLVQGKGEQIGLTDKYQYHISEVLIIFEVKKTLNKAAFEDAYEHLSGVSTAFSEYFEQRCIDGFEPNISYAAKSFAQVTGKPEPIRYSDIHQMLPEDALVFYTLVQDTYSPLKIIHGYGGYKTEAGLRNVFLSFIEEQQGKHGFGTPSMPNLISSESFSIAKLTGMPFVTPRLNDMCWPIIGSSHDNVMNLMIELIWTKISTYCDADMPWGDDMDVEGMTTLLLGKYACSEDGERQGWMFTTFEPKESYLKEIENKSSWEPVFINAMTKSIVQCVGVLGPQNINSKSMYEVIDEANLSKEAFSEQLTNTNLLSVSNDGYIHLIGGAIHMVEVNDSSFAASSDRSRLDKWCEINLVNPNYVSFININ